MNQKKKKLYPLPKDGRVSFLSEIKMPDIYWSAIGYHCLNNLQFVLMYLKECFILQDKKLNMDLLLNPLI